MDKIKDISVNTKYNCNEVTLYLLRKKYTPMAHAVLDDLRARYLSGSITRLQHFLSAPPNDHYEFLRELSHQFRSINQSINLPSRDFCKISNAETEIRESTRPRYKLIIKLEKDRKEMTADAAPGLKL